MIAMMVMMMINDDNLNLSHGNDDDKRGPIRCDKTIMMMSLTM